MKPGGAALAFAAVLAAAGSWAQDTPPAPLSVGEALFNAEGYRAREYRAPTPTDLPGATVLDPFALLDLLDTGEPALIDVAPLSRYLDQGGGTEGRWIHADERRNIPGSTWLPNAGLGDLDPAEAAWFEGWLERLSEGSNDRPLVFYCYVDCWMSWNAAKRALSFGYGQVHWFPEGTDGWDSIGEVLEPAEPEAPPDP